MVSIGTIIGWNESCKERQKPKIYILEVCGAEMHDRRGCQKDRVCLSKV